MTTESTDPWPIGSKVKVVRPEEGRTGRLGMVGEITQARHYEAVKRHHPDGSSEMVTPEHWFVFLVFARASWADWRATRAGDDWEGFFDRELEPAL